MSIDGMSDVSSSNPTTKPQGGASSQNGSSTPRHHRKVNPIIAYFTDKRFTICLGIFIAVLALFYLVASIEYLNYGTIDESVVAGRTVQEIVDSGESVENSGGAFGAWLANALMVNGFGLASFVLVVYFGVLAFALFKVIKCRFWAFTFKSLFTMASLSIILGLFTYNSESVLHWGGTHGRYVNQWLVSVADVLGAYAVSIILIAFLIVMYYSSVSDIIIGIVNKVKRERRVVDEAVEAENSVTSCLADIPEDTDKKTQNVVVTTQTLGSQNPAKPETPQLVQPTTPSEIGFDIDDVSGSEPLQSENKPSSEEPEFTINTATLGEVTQPATEQPTDAIQPYNVRDELSRYTFPGTDLLIDRPVKSAVDSVEQQENKDLIVKTLKDYGIPISRIEATIGPTVTLYEIVPAEGVRIAQIKRLEDDIALSLAALGIRIIAPIPGKGTVGIEVPNRDPQTVSMFSVINSRKFRETKMALPLALGATINNDIFIEDLARMPHLLVAGATGMGKSVGLNCIIASLLYKKHPGELKFVLIDPKMVEFSLYSRLECHYLAKLPDEEDAIVTEASKALATLSALCVEMDQRYELLKAAGVRTVIEYNAKFAERRLNPEKGHKYMPYIVVIVDEFADLIMTAGKEISVHIARIAQKARAVGIHMIIATQRPSTDIITGMIKANFPARIAFRVAAMVDSRTILDCPGANRLIGRGDLLFSLNSKLERVQCAFIDTPEVEALVDFVSRQISYGQAYMLPEPENTNAIVPGAIDLSRRDDLFDDCARFVVQNSTASTSSLQRRFGIGYNKAGKIMDQMEAAGIVGPADGQRPRNVLVDSVALEDLLRTL